MAKKFSDMLGSSSGGRFVKKVTEKEIQEAREALQQALDELNKVNPEDILDLDIKIAITERAAEGEVPTEEEDSDSDGGCQEIVTDAQEGTFAEIALELSKLYRALLSTPHTDEDRFHFILHIGKKA